MFSLAQESFHVKYDIFFSFTIIEGMVLKTDTPVKPSLTDGAENSWFSVFTEMLTIDLSQQK